MSITQAFEMVIDDISGDVGYEEDIQEAMLEILHGRLAELRDIWGME